MLQSFLVTTEILVAMALAILDLCNDSTDFL